jgi:hypothetical protein
VGEWSEPVKVIYGDVESGENLGFGKADESRNWFRDESGKFLYSSYMAR